MVVSCFLGLAGHNLSLIEPRLRAEQARLQASRTIDCCATTRASAVLNNRQELSLLGFNIHTATWQAMSLTTTCFLLQGRQRLRLHGYDSRVKRVTGRPLQT
eukprot:m.138710 g.138710  ORF g.138710 m.138710 type:complete len:102 (-) comp17036_c0_seq9:1506-1811(-)